MQTAWQKCAGLKAGWSNFFKNRSGASMVEFAIVAVPVFLLIFGIIEIGLMMWANNELQNATTDAARMIRTGQAQNGGMDAAAIKAQICSEVVILSNCTSSLQLDVQNFPNFGQITPPVAIVNGKVQSNFAYAPGAGGQVVLVTSFYEWTLVDGLTSALLGNLADGNLLLQSSAVFRNEPF